MDAIELSHDIDRVLAGEPIDASVTATAVVLHGLLLDAEYELSRKADPLLLALLGRHIDSLNEQPVTVQ